MPHFALSDTSLRYQPTGPCRTLRYQTPLCIIRHQLPGLHFALSDTGLRYQTPVTMSYYLPISRFVTDGWDNLPEYLHSHGRIIQTVTGDGMCLLNAVLLGLSEDNGINILFEDLKSLLIDHLIVHSEKYTNFSTLDANSLLDRVLTFFETQEYKEETVDWMLPIVADTIDAQILVYQRVDNNLCITTYNKSDILPEVHLKFSSQHYDTIKKVPHNLLMLSRICSDLCQQEEPLDLTTTGRCTPAEENPENMMDTYDDMTTQNFPDIESSQDYTAEANVNQLLIGPDSPTETDNFSVISHTTASSMEEDFCIEEVGED